MGETGDVRGIEPLRVLQDDRSGVPADRGAPAGARRRVRDLRGGVEGPDASSRTSSLSATPTGRIRGVVGVAFDITERKNALAELRAVGRAARRPRSTRPPTASSSWTPNGQMVHFNRRFVDMWGIPTEIVESRDENRAMAFVLEPAQGSRRLREEGHDGLRAAGHRQPRRRRARRRAADRARLAAAGRRRQDGRPRLELPRRDRAPAGRAGHRGDAVAAQGHARGHGRRHPRRRPGRPDRQLQQEVRRDVADPRRRHRSRATTTEAIEFVLDQLRDPERFVKKVKDLYDAARGQELRLARVQGRADVRALLLARRRSAGSHGRAGSGASTTSRACA